MKKQVYIKPEIQVVELESQGALLAGSTGSGSNAPGITRDEEGSIDEGYVDARPRYDIW